jgi:hypothetical protein
MDLHPVSSGLGVGVGVRRMVAVGCRVTVGERDLTGGVGEAGSSGVGDACVAGVDVVGKGAQAAAASQRLRANRQRFNRVMGASIQ